MLPPDPPAIDPDRDARVRQSLGACLEVAERVDLAATAPAGDLCSSGYCLVDMSLGAPAIVLAPDGGPVELDLTAAAGALAVEWFELATGAWTKGADVEGGGPVTLIPPFEGPAAALVGAE